MSDVPDSPPEEVNRRLDSVLDRILPPADHYPPRLHEAMRYACTGGKRLRGQLVYAAATVLGLPHERVDHAAAAVELVHAYSLVHDDLPAMDDDDLRRGRATVHCAYDEATAILVGDGLQALAFEILSADCAGLRADQQLRMVRILAKAAGTRGMVGGQSVDIDSERRQLSLAELEALHIHKTGALIRACLQLAVAAADGPPAATAEALDTFGKCIGLAFQIQDDVLDLDSSAAMLGKSVGKDEASGKCTYPAVMGLPAARTRAAELFARAREAVTPLGDPARPLLQLALAIQTRSH